MGEPKNLGVFSEPLDEAGRHELGTRWMQAMKAGDFEAAWQQTDRLERPRRERQRLDRSFQPEPWHLCWDGTPLENRRVLVRCQHGLGDTLQFMRYCAALERRGCEVVLKAQPALLNLLAGAPGVHELVNAWTTDPDPRHDVAIECMELPYAFRGTVESLPREVPYLAAHRFSPPMLPATGLRVGVIWAASAWDSSRSLPLAALAPLATVPSATFYNLQQGPERAQAASRSFPFTALPFDTTAAEDAAAAMLAMDVIITVDGMTAHLAGALGCRTFLMLSPTPDWRWLDEGTRSPWYPTMQVFRSTAGGGWPALVAEVKRALHQWAPTPLAPAELQLQGC